MTTLYLVISSVSNSNCKSKTTIVEDIYIHHIQVSGLHAPSLVWEISLFPTLKRGHVALKLVCGEYICLLLLWFLIYCLLVDYNRTFKVSFM